MRTKNEVNYGWLRLLLTTIFLASASLSLAQPQSVSLDQGRVDSAKLVSVDLARKAAQAHVDTVAKSLPGIYKDAVVSGDPTLCYDLDGNAIAYVFEVCKGETAVGYVAAGADPEGPTIYMASDGISPKEARRVAYESWGQTAENLRVDIAKGRSKIFYMGGLDFYLSPSEAESKAMDTEYIALRGYSRVSTNVLRKMQTARMQGLARAKKAGNFRTSWQNIANYKPLEKPVEPVPAKAQPMRMRPMLRQGDRLVPLPENRQGVPPPVDGPIWVYPPRDKTSNNFLSVLERGKTYILTYNAQNATRINIYRFYQSPYEGTPNIFVDNVVTNLKRDETGRYEWYVASKFRPEYRCLLAASDANNPRITYLMEQHFYLAADRTLDDLDPFMEYRAEAASVEGMNLNYLSERGFPDLHFKSSEFYWEPFEGRRSFTYAAKALVDILARNMKLDDGVDYFERGGVSLADEVTGAKSTTYELGYGSWQNSFGEIFPPETPVDMLHDPQAQIFRAVIDRKRPMAMGWPGNILTHTYVVDTPNAPGWSPPLVYGSATSVWGFAFHTNEADRDSRIFFMYLPGWNREIVTFAYEAQTGPADAVLFDYHELVPPDMVVKFPSAPGIYITRGQNVKIKWGSWASQTGSSKVKVELYRNGSRVATVTDSTDNNGEISWTLPTSLAAGAGYKIKVTSKSNSDIFDTSDKDFTIPSAREVTSPSSSGIIWRKGQSYPINWRGFVGTNVRIDLYKGSNIARTISSSTVNDGSYIWTVPADMPLGSGYNIVVSETANRSQYDRSTGTFDILPWPKVLAPNSNRTYLMGSAYDIKWSGFRGSNVSIVLYQGSSAFTTVTASTANDGSYRWYIPLTMPNGYYQVRITSKTPGPMPDSDRSDDDFFIYIPTLFLDLAEQGSIDSSGDADYYRFMLPGTRITSIETSPGLLADTTMYLSGPTTPSMSIESDDDGGRQMMSRIDRPLMVGGQYYFLKVRPHSPDLRGNYYIKVTTMSAPQIYLDNTYRGRINNPGNVDWTTFTIPTVGQTTIMASMDTLPGGRLTLFDSTGKQLISVGTVQGDIRIDRILQPGFYYLRTESGKEDGIGSFRLQLTQNAAFRRGSPAAPKAAAATSLSAKVTK